MKIHVMSTVSNTQQKTGKGEREGGEEYICRSSGKMKKCMGAYVGKESQEAECCSVQSKEGTKWLNF